MIGLINPTFFVVVNDDRIASWRVGVHIVWGKLDVDRYTRKEYRKRTDWEMAMSKCTHLARVDDRESWLA